MRITTKHIIRFIEEVATLIMEHCNYLTELDTAIGDADHGLNLNRGFCVVLTKLPNIANQDIGTILKTVGTTLVSTVGGASGPLYGTAFLRAGIITTDRFELDFEDIIVALEVALEGIIARGKAKRGEKTMIDAIAPGIDALKQAQQAGDNLIDALRKATTAAEQGMQATIFAMATKGRAAALGERSIGHQDPGATSAYLMTQALLKAVEVSDA